MSLQSGGFFFLFPLDNFNMKKLKIGKRLQSFLRKIEYDKTESIGTFRFGEDIVIADGYVEHHTDSTELGKDTIVCVLLNYGDYDFNYDF